MHARVWRAAGCRPASGVARVSGLDLHSALLQVRRSQAQIDMPVVLEAMEKIKLGLRHQPLPPSDAKRRMAALLAARAVSRPLLCPHITAQLQQTPAHSADPAKPAF